MTIQTIAWTFHFRWILWGVGALFSVFLVIQKLNPRLFKSRNFRGVDRFIVWGTGDRASDHASDPASNHDSDHEPRFIRNLLFICGTYLGLAWLAKYSQYLSMELHGQDFWLFADILEQMKSGKFFLTRFAPHELGWVQHGVVHPMFSWILLMPITWILGSLHAALLFNPLVLSLAGVTLGLLTRKKWGAQSSLVWVTAFLVSTQVGKNLMYEVHPEVAYPLFLFLWLWSIGLDGSGKVRPFFLVFSTLACAGLKEDSFLVLGPWMIWSLVFEPQISKKAVYGSGLMALGVSVFQIVAVRNWISGDWGPSVWGGSVVMTQPPVGFLEGFHWSGWSDIQGLIQKVLQLHGGFSGWLASLGSFILSRPFISLLILAPWVLFEFKFWWVILPIATVYSILEGPKYLWNYYSAPFLGSFWYCAALGGLNGLDTWVYKRVRAVTSKFAGNSKFAKNRSCISPAHWALIASCLLGSGSIDFYFPSAAALEMRHEAQVLASCLGNRGMVSSHLLGVVPLNRVWTERIPQTEAHWQEIDFILFSPQMNRYEISHEKAQQLEKQLLADSKWQKIGLDCQPQKDSSSETTSQGQHVLLFKRIKN